MRTVYLAGANASNMKAVAGKHVLISYHGAASSQRAMLAARAEGKVAGLILDCGAFTAWSKGTPVELEGYIAFVKAAIAAGPLDYASALDVIPGAPGRVPTEAEVASAKAATFANLTAMLAAGIPAAKLLPVVTLHDADWAGTINRYLAMGFSYMALGGCAKASKALAKPWLDAVFAAFPGVAFHLLGMTRKWADSYPARSCDSTSWYMLAKNRRAEGGQGFEDNRYVADGLAAWSYRLHQPTAMVAAGAGHDLSDDTLRAVGAYGLTTRAAGGEGGFLPTAAAARSSAFTRIALEYGAETDLGLLAEFFGEEAERGVMVLPEFAWTALDAEAADEFAAEYGEESAPVVPVVETTWGQLAWAFAS